MKYTIHVHNSGNISNPLTPCNSLNGIQWISHWPSRPQFVPLVGSFKYESLWRKKREIRGKIYETSFVLESSQCDLDVKCLFCWFEVFSLHWININVFNFHFVKDKIALRYKIIKVTDTCLTTGKDETFV